MPKMNFVLCGFAFLMMIILIIGTAQIYRTERAGRRYIQIMLSLEAAILLTRTIRWSPLSIPHGGHLPQVMDCLYFIFYYSLLSIFVYFLNAFISDRKKISLLPAHLTVPVCAIFALLWIVSSFTGIFYSTEKGVIRTQGPLYFVGGIAGYFVGLVVIYLLVVNRKVLKTHEIIAFLTFVLCPLIGLVVAQITTQIDVVPLSLALSLLLIQNFVQYNRVVTINEQKQRIAEDRVYIMMSQIRPHFIYNVLNTIYHLITIDPKKAQEAIGLFSNYLRMNFGSLEKKEKISIWEELKHIKIYLELEKMRFGDDLVVMYDVVTEEFFLPPLTVEPFVENAVKHGIAKCDDGGRVLIRIRENEKGYEIVVQDSGIGFDMEAQEAGEKGRIGIRNIRERLTLVCDGTLEIRSTRGMGTTAEIFLPKGSKAI